MFVTVCLVLHNVPCFNLCCDAVQREMSLGQGCVVAGQGTSRESEKNSLTARICTTLRDEISVRLRHYFAASLSNGLRVETPVGAVDKPQKICTGSVHLLDGKQKEQNSFITCKVALGRQSGNPFNVKNYIHHNLSLYSLLFLCNTYKLTYIVQ